MGLSGDQVTLGIAIWGAGAGTFSLIRGERSTYWARFDRCLDPVREPIAELLLPSGNPTDPQQVLSLFSVKAGSNMQALVDASDQVPGLRPPRWLRSAAKALQAAKGGQQPAKTDGTQAPLTPAQKKHLVEAHETLTKLQDLANKAARKA